MTATAPQPTLELAANLALGEMCRRLEFEAADIPHHVLGQFTTNITKLIEHQEEAGDQQQVSLLDQLDGLPRSRAIDLLRDECERLLTAYNRHRARLFELEGETQDASA